MINFKFFSDLLKKYAAFNSQRHQVIKLSNDAIRVAKQAIFELHRGNGQAAVERLDTCEKIFSDLERNWFKKDAELKLIGAYSAAIEEYVEAKFFYLHLAGKKIDYLKMPFPIGYDEYLSGICDLTGEMTRKALALAADGKVKEVLALKETVNDIIGELIKFDLLGKLRVKYEEAKRNLKKLEEIVYDLKIRKLK